MKLPIDDSFDVYTLLNGSSMCVDNEHLCVDVLISKMKEIWEKYYFICNDQMHNHTKFHACAPKCQIFSHIAWINRLLTLRDRSQFWYERQTISLILTSSNGTFSMLLAICVGNAPVTGEFPTQRPVTRSFDISLISAWTNGWANNRDAGDLRRHRPHYDVTVICRHGPLLLIRIYFHPSKDK